MRRAAAPGGDRRPDKLARAPAAAGGGALAGPHGRRTRDDARDLPRARAAAPGDACRVRPASGQRSRPRRRRRRAVDALALLTRTIQGRPPWTSPVDPGTTTRAPHGYIHAARTRRGSAVAALPHRLRGRAERGPASRR